MSAEHKHQNKTSQSSVYLYPEGRSQAVESVLRIYEVRKSQKERERERETTRLVVACLR